ncbi:tetratricopeptide repeat-containing sensor histidine kinase [Psychroflexus planctonicus]|uniref:histidine kinase n=1 Tax=Psychroflexus planctonicus TaxID=1526575 RepID=A0ABQ1SJ63_9FLAO|nr:tetratricopeptide repeat-containing sensor histidine kinase [Psychroflexus planctonicus]GGE36349.1 hypothetical protein GCM10010832_15700 [Psychroflexus planctonicus]
MRLKKIIIALLLLVSNTLQSQSNPLKPYEVLLDSIDNLQDVNKKSELFVSLFTQLKNEPDNVKKSRLLRKLSNRLYNNGFYEESYKVSLTNLQVSKEAKDTLILSKTYKDIGDYYYKKSVNDSSFYYYQQSLKFLKPESASFVQALISKAELYKNESHFIEAEKVLVDAIRIAKRNKNYRQLYDAYIVLAITLNSLKDYDEAIKNYDEAFNYLDELKSDDQYPLLVAQTLNNKANVYVEQENYTAAISNYQMALSDEVKKFSDVLYAAVLDNLAYAQFLAGGENPEALFLESLAIRNQINNRLGVVVSKKRLGEFYLSNKDTLKSETFLNEASELAEQTNFIRELLEILELKAKAEPQKASQYLNRHIQLKDSLLQVERITREKFAKIELDTEEVITENALLNRRLTIVYISAFSAAGLLFLLYLIFKQRAKNKLLLLEQEQQKSNQEVFELLLEQQQNVDQARRAEKDKIASELHDGIVSEIFGTRLHIMHFFDSIKDKASKEAEPYIHKLSDLENKIRTLSHELKSKHQLNLTGFDSILKNLFEEFEFNTSIKIHLHVAAEIHWEEIDYNIKVNLYRIFQESLTNVRKYAEASQVQIHIQKVANQIAINFKDDGKGFDVQKTNDGIGLKNLKNRISNLKGNVEISSNADGTTLFIEIPLS